MRTGPFPPRVWLNPVAVWELLDQLDISQNQLARLAGISPGHLSLLMNGKRSPAPGVRQRLMKALGVDDFHVLFVMERPAAGGGSGGRATTPNASGNCLECRDD
ncbi:MAG: helix-turn-helix transcriptional regulator [Chloroflexota bacterium]|nr:helix-turn-helix transcriptional regulator [Chloroflexota bacterium]MDE2684602.1 helix-turn-helix transcriptional regulator [Chloroflexota bacterium]